MKHVLYSISLKSIATVFCIVMSVVASAQRFETRKVVITNNGTDSRTVKIKSTSAFSIKKDSRIKWLTFEIGNKSVNIKATANTAKNSRSCHLIMFNDMGNAVDTLQIEQNGTISISVIKSSSRLAGSTTKTSYSKGVSGGQCAAKTKKGTRCSRKASAGSIYCWQHNKKANN